MGNLYLRLLITLIFLGKNASVAFAEDAIIFDQEVPETSPYIDEGTIGNDLIELRNRREEREERGEKKGTKKKQSTQPKQKMLLIEAGKDRPYTFLSQVSLILPYLKTAGQRTNYTTELTTHLMSMLKVSSRNVSEGTLWAGLRLSPFSGTGKYKQTTARYNFLYFGPAFSYGSIETPEGPEEDPEAATIEHKPKNTELVVRSSSFFSWGIALQSRLVKVDHGPGEGEGDFKEQKGVRFDSPGFWAEYSMGNIHYGTLGLNYATGFLIGDKKYFAWVGITASFWY